MPKVATRVDVDALLIGLSIRRDVDGTEGRVLDASAAHLVESGLAGFEVDDVADASGVGRSTIYRRFGDRNGLISATLSMWGNRFLTDLATAVQHLDRPEDQVVAAFSAGLEVAERSGLAELVRSEPMLLRLLTVDGESLVAAARDQLVAIGSRVEPGSDSASIAVAAEMLIRLAISLVVTPGSCLPSTPHDRERALRSTIGPLMRIS